MNILDRRFKYTPARETTPEYLRAKFAAIRERQQSDGRPKQVNDHDADDSEDLDCDGPEDGVCPDCGEIWDICECRVGEECGRWVNGRLSKHCRKAGSEECDFECPHRSTLKL